MIKGEMSRWGNPNTFMVKLIFIYRKTVVHPRACYSAVKHSSWFLAWLEVSWPWEEVELLKCDFCWDAPGAEGVEIPDCLHCAAGLQEGFLTAVQNCHENLAAEE